MYSVDSLHIFPKSKVSESSLSIIQLSSGMLILLASSVNFIHVFYAERSSYQPVLSLQRSHQTPLGIFRPVKAKPPFHPQSSNIKSLPSQALSFKWKKNTWYCIGKEKRQLFAVCLVFPSHILFKIFWSNICFLKGVSTVKFWKL